MAFAYSRRQARTIVERRRGGHVQRRHLISLAYVARDFAIGVLFVYGYIYTAYKYGNPLFGRNDFFKCQAMIGSPFDFSATTAPFVLRQIPAILAAGFYKLGLHYDTMAVVDLIGLDRDIKRRFLALIMSNGLAVCLSFAILCHYLRTKLPTFGVVEPFALFGIFAAWFYFPSGAVAPATVGWGWFASSLFAIALLERSLSLTCLACLIGVFARETTLIFALVMLTAVLLFDGERSRNVVLSAIVLIAGCLTYLILRKLFTAGYEHQISPRAFSINLTSFRRVTRLYLPIGLVAGAVVASDIWHRRQNASLCRLSLHRRRRGGGRCIRRQSERDRPAVGRNPALLCGNFSARAGRSAAAPGRQTFDGLNEPPIPASRPSASPFAPMKSVSA